MFLRKSIRRVQMIYWEYPGQFWTIIGASFVDRLGGALIYPFFALYITDRFAVGMTEVGILFALFSLTDLLGNLVGGALTDHLGRKRIIIVGLVVSGLTSLGMGLMNRIEYFYLMGVISGLFATAAQPAHQAMLTDILPAEQRAEGFGVMRIAVNLAVAIGPAIGGLFAAASYLILFIADMVTSLITAAIVALVVKESRPEAAAKSPDSFSASLAGYRKVISDRRFMLFLMIFTIGAVVYIQMYSTLSVFLRDVHGVPETGYGWLMTLNASMVVLFQFLVTRKVTQQPPMLVMAFGSLLYVIGFGMYGVVSIYVLFMLAMAIITVGEMVIVPVAHAYVGEAAPDQMRGRYMGMMGLAWLVPGMIGPLLAGLIIDHANPNWVWYGCAVLGTIAVIGFLGLQAAEGRQRDAGVEASQGSERVQ